MGALSSFSPALEFGSGHPSGFYNQLRTKNQKLTAKKV
jgi:hypothetical protein